MNESLGDMFAEAGDISAGRGFIVRAYRNANRALPQALKETNQRLAIRDIMFELRRSVEQDLHTSFQESLEAGVDESARQLEFYGIQSSGQTNSIDLSRQVDTAVESVVAQIDAQEAKLNALILNEIDEALILGDEERQGVLRPADILTTATYWIAALAWDGFQSWTMSQQGTMVFQKQVIAALDARTTDCCLHVHGQIVDLNKKFHLTGTPRFADSLEWTPFHWYCRSSIVLYLSQFDNGLTRRMREGANYLIGQRKLGKKPDQHPADAFWN